MRGGVAMVFAVLLLLAGCGSVPIGEPRPAPVMLVNNASQPETFTVGVVEDEANMTIRRQDGEVYNFTLPLGSLTYSTTSDNKFVEIEFPESARVVGEYRLRPGERKLVNVSGVTPDKTIVVLVYDEEERTYRAMKSLSCSGDILGYRVTTQKGGSDDWTMSTHQCSNW